MKLLYITLLTIFLASCGAKTKIAAIDLKLNIGQSFNQINKEKIWDVFDRKINILIIDEREENFNSKNIQNYQQDKERFVYLDKIIGYKKHDEHKITYLTLNQNIMPVLRGELAKGLKDRGFRIVADNYDRILTIILEDFSHITNKKFFIGNSKTYLKLRVKSGLYEKLYEIEIDGQDFMESSLEKDQKIINQILRDAIISILNNKKLITMLQG